MARKPNKDIRVSASDALEFEPEAEHRRRIPTTVWLLGVLVLVTVAGLGGFLFGDRLAGIGGDGVGNVPLVHAAEGPIKVRPENPGGQEIPFRDYDINNRMQGEEANTRVENLLPPPEQPKMPPQGAAEAPPAAAPAPIPQPSAVVPIPRKQKAEALLPAPKPAGHAAPAPTKTVAPAPAPVPVPPAAQPVGNGPIPLVPRSQQQQAAPPAAAPPAAPELRTAPAPKPAPEKAAPAPAAAHASAGAVTSGWQVQLAASREIKAAEREGERLRTKHSDLLGKYRVAVVQADLGAKGVFYRIRLGPIKDQEQARTLCAQLSKRGQGCLAVAPGK